MPGGGGGITEPGFTTTAPEFAGGATPGVAVGYESLGVIFGALVATGAGAGAGAAVVGLGAGAVVVVVVAWFTVASGDVDAALVAMTTDGVPVGAGTALSAFALAMAITPPAMTATVATEPMTAPLICM